jgi:hypothetical protein
MRRGAGLAARAVLIALCSGCGAESGISIAFESRALLERAATVYVYFYGPEVACQLIRQTTPRPPSVLGPFEAPVTPEGRERGISFTLDHTNMPIPVGTYVVFVDAVDADGAVVGTGCAPGQVIAEKELSQVQVVVAEQ